MFGSAILPSTIFKLAPKAVSWWGAALLVCADGRGAPEHARAGSAASRRSLHACWTAPACDRYG